VGDAAARDRLGADGADVDASALRDLYAYPDRMRQRGFVRANMVTSVDGAVTGSDGRSGSVSSPADREVFALLRALADVVLVGAGTARTERYRVPVADPAFAELRAGLGLASAPCVAVVTASGLVPDTLVTSSSRRRDDSWCSLVITTATIDPQRLSALMAALGDDGVVIAGEERVDLNTAVEALVERGMPRVLCEGGPSLLAQLTALGRVDELCHTTSPLLSGGLGRRMLAGQSLPGERSGLRLRHLLEADGTLLARWQLS
jgi:riboflavin biosynthesis pyrimidine reductase